MWFLHNTELDSSEGYSEHSKLFSLFMRTVGTRRENYRILLFLTLYGVTVLNVDCWIGLVQILARKNVQIQYVQ